MAAFDFTKLTIHNADGPDVNVDNTPWAQDEVTVRAYFGELSDPLIEHIGESTFAVGCCAWITHSGVITALSKLDFGSQIVCQKEDFLRPDSINHGSFKNRLHALYGSLRCQVDRHACSGIARLGMLSTGMDEGNMDPIRCVGNHNSERHPAWPRMHHKFLVFCHVEKCDKHRLEDGCYCDCEPTFGMYGYRPIPFAVWTGSFNPTENGTKSRENAVLIESKSIATAYFREWYQMFALSEQLDWSSEWIQPEYRIGT